MKWHEFELEEWIVNHPETLFGSIIAYESEAYPSHTELLGRQVPCKTGRIDLLFTSHIDHPYTRVTIWVVELKAQRVRPNAVEQVLRYKTAIESVDIYDGLDRSDFHKFGHYLEDFIEVIPVLVAPTFGRDTAYFGHRVAASKDNDGAFHFSVQKPQSYSTYSNQTLARTLTPALRRAASSARSYEVMRRMDASPIKIGEN